MADLLERLQDALASRYRIQRELGRGGMATVLLAEDLKHHRPVALKVLSPELAAVLGPERFLREIETVGRLTHPHILPLYDSGNAGGLLYYVMPYVGGESLRDRLRREKQLPVDDALRIARGMTGAQRSNTQGPTTGSPGVRPYAAPATARVACSSTAIASARPPFQAASAR